MRRIKILCAALGALLSVSAILSSAASAKEIPLLKAVLSSGPVPIEKGDPLFLHSANVVISAGGGVITCNNGNLSGVLNTNGLRTDSFSITGGSFSDEGEEFCGNNIVPGPAKLVLPGQFSWAGTAKTRGKTALMGPMFTVEFPQVGVFCTMQATRLKSTFNHDGMAITVMTSNGKFKLMPGSSSICPKMGTLSASWSLRTKLPGNQEGLPVALLP